MNRSFFTLILTLFMLYSCTDRLIDNDPSTVDEIKIAENNADSMLSIKLNPSVLSQIQTTVNELKLPTGSSKLNDYLVQIGAIRLRRVFPYAGKHEDRQVKERLNAWYTVWIDPTKAHTTRASAKELTSGIVDIVEPVRIPKLEEYQATEAQWPITRSANTGPYDDPMFPKQWDLDNRADYGNGLNQHGKQVISSIKGADVNAIRAWSAATARRDVVVAVVDGGIDTEHEDLKDNLWVNENEIPGNNIDDDNNGYIDDINGYNFVDDSGTLVPHDHGTHVAGTVSARNNNGKGVCSIAGGNGSENSGARIMSCQIFKPNPNYDPNDKDSKRNLSAKDYNAIAAAIVYGANNGALISQNSWGFPDLWVEPQVIKEAIHYFNLHAGEYVGSPMKGGIVFFAAGNDSVQTKYYPAADPEAIAVAATASDFSATWYTNYGTWVQISAPGGSSPFGGKFPYVDGKPYGEILSTLPVRDGQSRYGYMQGTSMACPHMSSIAALVISKYGGANFTNTELRQKILSGTKYINPDNHNTLRYQDKIGAGYADAYMALQETNPDTEPATAQFITEKTVSNYTDLQLAWQSPDVTAGALYRYTLYYAESPITEANCQTADVKRINIAAFDKKTNDETVRTIFRLKTGTRYYAALRVTARNGKATGLIAYPAELSTLINTAPTITVPPNIDMSHLEVAGNDVTEIAFTIKDKENHRWNYTITDQGLLYTQREDDLLRVRFFANKMRLGVNKYTLTVTDQYGAERKLDFYFNKRADSAPFLKQTDAVIIIAKNEKKTIDLTTLITDEYPESLSFELGNELPKNVKVSLREKELTLEAQKLGEAKLQLHATDNHRQTISVTIPVLVYMNRGIYSLFPTIAATTLYIKLGDAVNGNLTLNISNAAGKRVKQQAYDTTQLDPKKRTIMIDVSTWIPGRYDVSIENQGQIYSETFIKQ